MTTLPRPALAPGLFVALTNVDVVPSRLQPLLSGDQPLPGQTYSMRAITARLGAMLGLSQEQSARLLGISRSTALKSAPPSPDVLDRLYALSQRLELMQGVLGEAAGEWFTTPSAALDGARPLDLLRTRTGQAQLDDLIQGLLDGNFH